MSAPLTDDEVRTIRDDAYDGKFVGAVDRYGSICATLMALCDQLLEARKDSARVDWIEHRAASLHCNFISGPECFTVTLHDVAACKDHPTHAESVRAAIDGAALHNLLSSTLRLKQVQPPPARTTEDGT